MNCMIECELQLIHTLSTLYLYAYDHHLQLALASTAGVFCLANYIPFTDVHKHILALWWWLW